MISSKAGPRSVAIAQRVGKSSAQRRYFRAASAVANRPSPGARKAAMLLSFTIGAGCLYNIGFGSTLHAEAVPAPAEVKFEESRKKASSKEENRDLISSQHLQVKKSWENPGVYAWGSNSRGHSIRARKLFGWEPKQPKLIDLIPEIVALEAKDLGLK